MATITKQFTLEGLCCGNCAAKIAGEIAQLDGVATADIDIISQTLTMEIDREKLINVTCQADSIVKRHDSAIVMLEKESRISGKKTISRSDPGCSEGKKSADWKGRAHRFSLACGALLFLAALFFSFPAGLELPLFLLSYLLVGGEVVFRALRNIAKGQVFDENFLMSVATVGAFAIGEYPEGVAVMLFYQIGEAFQDLAVNRSRKSISALMNIRPDFANLKTGDEICRVSPEEVNIGDLIIVKPGEKIPLDGRVLEGRSTLDTSALTGESLPRDVEPGNEVLAGSINKSALLTIRVTREFGESTVAKILDLVQNASSRKARTENFITKFARYYTPFVVFAALALAVLPPLFIPGALLADWVYRALVFLVVSCPCALVISIPLSFFGGIGGASRNGILIKGSNYLEALNHVDTVVFDKTGTLTKGVFEVAQIIPESGFRQEELIYYAAYAENYSTHPIAYSIRKAFGREIEVRRISGFEEISGQGIRAVIDGKTVLAGNTKLLETAGIAYRKTDAIGTVVYVAVDGVFAGAIVIADQIKADSRLAVQTLKKMNVRQIVMLTGDSKAAGEKVGWELGLDAVYSDLLPHQKVEQMEILEKEKPPQGKLVFVGDGINDAPVLARADIGIAMGGLGSDAAIEAADVVFMTDEPSKLATAILIAKKTRRIVWQNIIFALGVKGIILILAAAGIATMWEAVFGDVGVAVLAILNAIRAMRVVTAVPREAG